MQVVAGPVCMTVSADHTTLELTSDPRHTLGSNVHSLQCWVQCAGPPPQFRLQVTLPSSR